MRQRPGIMAPPTLYDEPASTGLWSVAVVLAAVELFFELAS